MVKIIFHVRKRRTSFDIQKYLILHLFFSTTIIYSLGAHLITQCSIFAIFSLFLIFLYISTVFCRKFFALAILRVMKSKRSESKIKQLCSNQFVFDFPTDVFIFAAYGKIEIIFASFWSHHHKRRLTQQWKQLRIIRSFY